MPDFGIIEGIAALTALGSEFGAAGAGIAEGVGAAGAGLLGGAEAAGAGLAGGLGDLFGGAEGALSGLFGAGGAEGAAAGEAGLAGTAGGLTAPAAGGLAPAAAGPIDAASALSADVTAFAPTGGGVAEQAGGIFGGFSPGEVGFGDVPQIAGSNVTTGASFAPGEVGGFNVGSLGVQGTGPATGFGDLTSLGGAGGANPAGDLASLAAPAGGGGGAPGGAAELAGVGGANPAAPAGGGGFFDNLGTSAVSSLTKNPLGIAAAGAGLGYNILQGQKLTGNQQALTGQAQQMAGQGQQLQQYLQNGTLPPGMQQQVDNAKQAARAQIISGYASRGQNSNPSQNSALAQELAAVDTNALELQGKIATNLLTAGINETNMSANLFQALIQMDQTQAKQMGSAISNFASALAGGPRTIQVGGTSTA